MNKIKIAIIGYGNLGKGVEKAAEKAQDIEIFGVFTRRDIDSIDSKNKVLAYKDILKYKDQIDVAIICTSSKSDVYNQGIELVKDFNIVDAFDNHRLLPGYFQEVDKIGKVSNKLAIVGTGWDPGLFSLNRLIAEEILKEGKSYTFWGPGLSQGHSEAVRSIEGVKLGVQYTVPKEEILDRIRKKEEIEVSSQEGHKRVCYIVLEEWANKDKVEKEIREMPDYFKGYQVEIHFIDEEEFNKNHSSLNHGGRVMRIGKTSEDNSSLYEFSLDLDSNPEFTGSVALAFARACHRLNQEGLSGGKTIFSVPLAYLSAEDELDLIKKYL